MNTFLFNHSLELVPSKEISILSTALKYGEGCFETMYYQKGIIRLVDKHFQRLQNALSDLNIHLHEHFNQDWLLHFLQESLDHTNTYRVRLGVYPVATSLDIHASAAYLTIEAMEWIESAQTIEVGVLENVQPALFPLQQYKLNNYHLYSYAIRMAKKMQKPDVLLINPQGFVLESSIANIIVRQGNSLITPPTSLGIINGVMRQYLMEQFQIEEKNILRSDLSQADEIILINALTIRSVLNWEGRILSTQTADQFRSKIQSLIP